MRDLYVSVQRGKKRVVEGGENLRLSLDMRELLRAQGIAVDDFEGEVCVVIVAEAAEEDAAEVPGADEALELEVSEVEGAVGGQCGGGVDSGPVGVVLAAVGAVVDVGDGGGRGGGGGGGGEAGLVEAESEAAPSQAAAGGESAVGGDGGEAEV